MFSKFKLFWQKILSWLHVTMSPGGLEVGDHAIRWCRMIDGQPQTATVALPPGVCEDGRILDLPAFSNALHELRAISLDKAAAKNERILVALTVSSLPTFMRLFELPLVEGSRLESAVSLNLKMAAPKVGGETAAGWRVVERDADRSRMLIGGVFTDQAAIDAMVAALRGVGFIAITAESKPVSLARAIAKSSRGIDPAAPYLAVSCDDMGIDFLIIRGGALAFAYSVPWRDLTDSSGTVAGDRFAGALIQGIRQIVTFYGRHWTDAPAAVLVLAGDLFASVHDTIANEVSQSVAEFIPVAPDGSVIAMPVAFGIAVRGVEGGAAGQDVTFLGADAAGIYKQEKVIFFFHFWQVALPVFLGVILAILFVGDVVWLRGLEANAVVGAVSIPPAIPGQLALLGASAETFNQSVSMVRNAESSVSGQAAFFSSVSAVAASSSVTLSRITAPGGGSSATISGSAVSEDEIIAFKNALVSDAIATSVSLPISAIQPTTGGYLFTMTVAAP